MELLDVKYDVKTYYRNKNFRAPEELKKIHPLGKSPVIEVKRPGEETEVIAESGRIVEYLIENFDKSGKLTPKTKKGKDEVSYYLHFTEGSLQSLLTSFFVLDLAKDVVPWFAKPLVVAVTSKINQAYFGSETLKNLEYLENISAKKNGGYFVEDKITGADVILSFPVAELVFGGHRDHLFDEPPKSLYPNLYKWSQKVFEDPAYKKATSVINESKL